MSWLLKLQSYLVLGRNVCSIHELHDNHAQQLFKTASKQKKKKLVEPIDSDNEPDTVSDSESENNQDHDSDDNYFYQDQDQDQDQDLDQDTSSDKVTKVDVTKEVSWESRDKFRADGVTGKTKLEKTLENEILGAIRGKNYDFEQKILTRISDSYYKDDLVKTIKDLNFSDIVVDDFPIIWRNSSLKLKLLDSFKNAYLKYLLDSGVIDDTMMKPASR